MSFEGPEKWREVATALAKEGGKAHARTIARTLWPDSPLWGVRAKRPGTTGQREFGPSLISSVSGLLGRMQNQIGYVRRLGAGEWELTEKGWSSLNGPAVVKARWPLTPPLPPWPWPPGTRVQVPGADGRLWPAVVVTTWGNEWVCVQYPGTPWTAWVYPYAVVAAA
jgi:hypothetical protein